MKIGILDTYIINTVKGSRENFNEFKSQTSEIEGID